MGGDDGMGELAPGDAAEAEALGELHEHPAENDESRRRWQIGGRRKLLDEAQSMSFDVDVESQGLSEVDEQGDELRFQARLIVKKLYPANQAKPTLQDLVNTVLSERSGHTLWKRGDWVEYLGDDMQWHIAQVRGVVRQAPDSFDWTDAANENVEPEYQVFYNVGPATLMPENTVRAAEAGLRAVFGSRPWVWQQYALLMIERYVWFKKDHERDFMEIDCQKFADDLFEAWLHDERNADFKNLFHSYPERQRDMLVYHLITPFELLDNITEDEDAWHFADEDMSVYTYLSTLGSGSMFIIVCFVLQFTIPLFLLVNALQGSERFDADLTDSSNFHLIADWDLICNGEGNMVGKLMIMAVVSLYLLTVIPESLIKFYRTTGESATTYSKLNSLRNVVWMQSDDTLGQQLGFKLDRYMNTAYVCWLYGVMLFILFNTDDVLDILLNALAGEFVHQIDEQVAGAEWYDPDNRWLTAGAWQLAVQSSLRLRILESGTLFCKHYDVDPSEYAEAMGGYMHGLKKRSLAARDDRDSSYLLPEDALFHECAVYCKSKNNEYGLEQFRKPLANFSLFDRFINFFMARKFGLFDQFRSFRVWSRWEKVLFMSRVPEKIDDVASQVPAERITKIRNDDSAFTRFSKDMLSVLGCYRMGKDISRSLRQRGCGRLGFHVIDGGIQWASYVVQMIFPILVTGGLIFIPVCY